MLRDGRVKPERRSSYFKLLARQSERLTFLMDNILDATSREIGKRRYYFEMISLDRLLEDFSTEFVPALEAEGFTLRLFIEKNLQKVRMDRAAVQQALTNLIDNARKFSSPGSNIDLKAGRAPGRQFISVRDYGPGIDAVTRKNIFRPFFRGTSATKAGIPGSGLGLSLVKSVMDSHKGTVRVESAPGEGSVFILEFPLRSKE